MTHIGVVDFEDLESGESFASARAERDCIAFVLSILDDGDVEIVVNVSNAEQIAILLKQAIEHAKSSD